MTDSATLDEGPLDSVAIAEFPKQGRQFEEARVFYTQRTHLYESREVSFGRLNILRYFEASGRCDVHFAFAPQMSDKRRELAYINFNSWQVITINDI
jgi:hypothetical protein